MCNIFWLSLFGVHINIYVVTRTTILAHFTCVMYRTYRLFKKNENERSLLFKYIIFIIVAPAIISIVIIIVDVTLDNSTFGADGACVYFYDTSDWEESKLTKANVIQFANLIIWLFIQIALATLGL